MVIFAEVSYSVVMFLSSSSFKDLVSWPVPVQNFFLKLNNLLESW